MAETEVGSAFVDLFVKDDKFNKGMARGESRTAKFAKNVLKFAAVAAVALGAVAIASFKVLIKQEEAEAKLEQVIRATGMAAGFTAEELKKEAEALQSLTKFGDEAVIELQALLATFREIKGDEFKDATALVLDMATLFGDTKSAAIQLGKALNDPIKGITALTRVGITFTEEQKKQIKNAQEQGRIAEAQRVILKELENQFGGVAAAAADTIGGRFEQLKNSIGDVGESFAASLGSGTGGLADLLLKARIEVDLFRESVEAMRDEGQGGSGGLLKDFAVGLQGVKDLIEGIKNADGDPFAPLQFVQDQANAREAERQARFAEAKEASARAKGLGGGGAGAGGEGGVPAQKRAKPTFTSFQNAIKTTQSLQAQKDDQKKIQLAEQSVKTEKLMLDELVELNRDSDDNRVIVTQ